jgi:penicillin-binding protein 2
VGERALRLPVLRILLLSLVVTLVARLYFVQVLDPAKPTQTAGGLHQGAIVVPAARGDIVDSLGRPLVANRTTQVVTVDRAVLDSQPDGGVAVLTALAPLLHTTAADLRKQITPCGITVPAPCWTGQPYQPVPVATDADVATVLAIGERHESFPGVAISTQTVRTYPSGSLASQEIGYVGQVTAADQKVNAGLQDEDTIGISGLEQQYDAALRGTDGSQSVNLDATGEIASDGATTGATQGSTLVTSIDANVQALAEKALASQIATSRSKGFAATSGAVVVMDPTTGRIIAIASYPTFDLTVFAGGISTADYAKLTANGSGTPLLSRAVAGAYAPGSTFKLVTASADVQSGRTSLTAGYSCPGSLNIGGQVKTNFDSEAIAGPVDLKKALQYSCDTFFYKFAADEWQDDQNRIAAGLAPNETLQAMARSFGFGTSVGVDLPASEQVTGSIADRETVLARWNADKDTYCAEAASGDLDEPDLVRRAYLVKLASENCTDGWRYRIGDNADLSIGQGETTVSPLQLAVAYSAMINGGTIWNPTIGWAVVDGAGKVTKTITPTVKNKVPVDPSILAYIKDSLHFQSGHEVSGAIAFDGSPIKTMIGGKTGTAEVYGNQDTSWLASWAPADDPKFVVVGMIEQGGLGSGAAAPMVRQIYEGLYGVGQSPAIAGSQPATSLPPIAARVKVTSSAPTTPTGTVGANPTPDATPAAPKTSTAKSSTAKSSTAKSSTAKSSTAKSSTAKSSTAKASTAKSSVGTPSTSAKATGPP